MQLRPRSAVFLTLVLLCPAAFPQELRRLNGPLARTVLADVIDYQVSADGKRVVVLADANVDGSFELYARDLELGLPTVRLDPPALADRVPVTGSLRLSADGTRLFYLAHPAASALRGLYSVALDGSASALELVPRTPGGSVQSFELDAAGGVVALADALVDERVELFRATPDGSTTPVLLSGALDANGDVTDFALDALDALGAFAVFRADARDDVFELFRVPLDGSGKPLRLNADLPSGGDVQPGFEISADGAVVYLADQLRNDRVELFAVRAGEAPVALSTTTVNGGQVERAQLSPDGSQVVFLANRLATNQRELFLVPRDGSRPPALLHAPLPSARFGVRDDFRIGPDGTRVAFRMDRNILGNYELYSAPLDGSATEVQLNQTSAVPIVTEFGFGAHDDRIAFRAQIGFHFHLYAVPGDGSAPAARLDPSLFSLSDTLGFVTGESDGESEVVFLSEMGNGNTPELYVAPLDAHAPARKLHPTLGFGDAVQPDFRIAPGGAAALYLADLATPGAYELYRSPLDVDAPPERLSEPIRGTGPVVGDVLSYSFAGERVLYFADQETAGLSDLYSVPLAGGAPPARLIRLVTGSRLRSLFVAPDGERVFFLSDGEENQRFELFVVAADGSAAARKLSGPLVAGGDVSAFGLSADGRWLVYRADQEVDEQFELYAVPTDGSSGPLRLAPQSHRYGDDESFGITPDSTRVVFTSDRAVRDKRELYVMPIDGSGAPVRVSAPLVGGGDVDPDFRITPDSTRVVYLADQDVNDWPELLSAPLDASAPAAKLNGPLLTRAGVRDFQLSDDGTRVLYRANQAGRMELFSAPIDGRTPARSFFPQPQHAFRAYEAVAGRALFYADPNGVRELFSAPLDAGGPAVKLNGPLRGSGGVGRYLVSPDRRNVVYLAAQEFYRHPDLYRVPLEGGLPPVRLTAGFSRHDVLDPPTAFQFDPQGRNLLVGVRDHGRDTRDLFLVPLDVSPTDPGIALRVSPKLPLDRDGCKGSFTPDGEHVVLIGDLAERRRFELFATNREMLAPAAAPRPLR